MSYLVGYGIWEETISAFTVGVDSISFTDYLGTQCGRRYLFISNFTYTIMHRVSKFSNFINTGITNRYIRFTGFTIISSTLKTISGNTIEFVANLTSTPSTLTSKSTSNTTLITIYTFIAYIVIEPVFTGTTVCEIHFYRVIAFRTSTSFVRT